MRDPVQVQEWPARRKGCPGRHQKERARDPAQTDTPRVFVEIAKDHRRAWRMALQRLTDGVKLTPPRRPQKAQMHRHDPQGRWPFKVDDHCAPGFQPRKLQSLQPADVEVGPGQQRVAVPAQTGGIASDRQRFQPGPGRNQVARQGRGSASHPEIRLLQRDDIGPKCRDPVQHPFGITPKVGSKTGPDIPRRQTQYGL